MNRAVVVGGNIRCTKMQWKTLRKIEDDLEKEMYKQIGIISGAFGIALYENWGWREKRIAKLFQQISDAWNECAADPNKSMLEMCEDETGIVVDIPEYEGDYKELKYFQKESIREELSIQQRIYMRIRQKKWLGAEMLAATLLALHRCYGFGEERINRLFQQFLEVRDRYHWDQKTIEDECFRITNVGITVK